MQMRSRRRQTGQMVSPFGILMGALIILTLGFVAFEVARMVIARDQLRAATDAAALAGAASLASSDLSDVNTSHTAAETAAQQMYTLNDIFGTVLSQTAGPDPQNPSAPPVAGHTIISYKWIDPSTGQEAQPPGSASGRVLEVDATFGYQPLFAGIFGTQNPIVFPLTVSSQGGVPKMDLVICFDVSGSMCDLTKLSLVKRSWDTANNKVVYSTTQQTTGFPSSYDPYPQRLGSPFSTELRNTENGPPGNHPSVGSAAAATAAASATAFTDQVVNLDANAPFQQYTDSATGLVFPNVDALLEASRGNLDPTNFGNGSSLPSSGKSFAYTAKDALQVGPGEPNGLDSRYKSAYDRVALEKTEPLHSSVVAVQNFLDLMQKNTQAHFGFVAFSGGNQDGGSIGQPGGATVETEKAIASNYSCAGRDPYQVPMPYIALNPGTGTTDDNHDLIRDTVLPKLVPYLGTVFGDALQAAITELKTHQRPNSSRVILLFTDGLNSDNAAAQQAAKDANKEGIPIYTIGLSIAEHGAADQQQQVTILTDQTGTQGIAALSGNGATFTQVSNPSDLNSAFQEIARRLTQLVK